MYIKASSEIKIGKVTLAGVHSVTIKQSVDNISNTAVVKIARAYKLLGTAGILDYIHVGDKVIIKLGYNGDLQTEFTGYVSSIGDETPIKIELEDAWYVHKKNRLNKAWQRVKLQEVLQYILPGYKVECPDVDLTSGFVIRNASSYAVAKELKRLYSFYCKINDDAKSLTCFYPYIMQEVNSHKYVFGTRKADALKQLHNRQLSPNVAKNNLEFIRKEDLKLCVTAKGQDKAGKVISVTIGSDESDAHKRTLNYGARINTKEALRAEAEKAIAQQSYDGYRGKIAGFGIPATQAGDTLQIVDVENTEREGSYLIKSVELTYSPEGGYRRINELGYKL